LALTACRLKPKSVSRTGIFLDEGGDDRGRRSRGRRHTAAAANDNGNGDAQIRIDAAVLTIARLIGRQMAREAFDRLKAANDNDPPERCED
jgi:hypothetical protein